MYFLGSFQATVLCFLALDQIWEVLHNLHYLDSLHKQESSLFGALMSCSKFFITVIHMAFDLLSSLCVAVLGLGVASEGEVYF